MNTGVSNRSPYSLKPVRWWQRLAGWLFVYSVLLVLLNAFVAPTDYPHQPGDGWRDLGKVYIALTTAWLVVRVSERQKRRQLRQELKSLPH
jgi:hypothetical protein